MNLIKIIALTAVVILVTACGGGGGGGGGIASSKSQISSSLSSISSATSSIGSSMISSSSSIAANVAPVANAGPDVSAVQSTQVILDGSLSADSDGEIVSYQWVKPQSVNIELINPDSSIVSFMAPAMNTATRFPMDLTVTDNDGTTHTDTVFVTITGTPNIAPVANAGDDKQANPNTVVHLDASKSFDEDGQFITFTWEQVSGPEVVLEFGSFEPKEVGVYVFRVIVRDDQLVESSDTVTITVISDNFLPTIQTPSSIATFFESETAILPTPIVTDADGVIVSYEWTLNEESQIQVVIIDADKLEASFVVPPLTESKNLYFTLKVTDDKGGVATSGFITATIMPVIAPPIANAGDTQIVSSGRQVQLNGTGSSDSDGSIVVYSWTQLGGQTVELSDAHIAQPAFVSPEVNETLSFRLEVTDNHGNSDADVVHINVASTLVPKTVRKTNPARLQVLWNQDIDADQFNIYYAKNKTVNSSNLPGNLGAISVLNVQSPYSLDAAFNEYINTHFTVEAVKDGQVVMSETVITMIDQISMSSSGGLFGCLIEGKSLNCWGDQHSEEIKKLINPRSVSIGGGHSCALDDTGVVCWGQNSWGQTDVPELQNPRYVAALDNQTCAIDDSGMHCWGFSTINLPEISNPTAVTDVCAMNNEGVYCYGEITEFPPVLSSPTQLSVTNSSLKFACALHDDGVACWGYSAQGQTNVPPLSNPSQISVGYDHACALDETGVVCWGGDGRAHTQVPLLSNPRYVSAGYQISCALDDSGLVCWGSQLAEIPEGIDLTNISKMKHGYQKCALINTDLNCWSSSSDNSVLQGIADFDIYNGQSCVIQNGNLSCSFGSWGIENVPAQTNPYLVATGYNSACSFSDEGLKCWGYQASSVVLAAPEIDNATELKVGGEHACAISNHELLCWSHNMNSYLNVPETTDPHGLSIGDFTSCVIDSGAIKCWGDMNNVEDLNISDLTNPTQVSVGGNHLCAIAGEVLKCWGGYYGESDIPVLYNPQYVSAGNYSTCAVDEYGLICWGYGAFNGFGWRANPRY